MDEAGRQVARYRLADSRSAPPGWRATDITVHPDQQLTDELALTLAVTAPCIGQFFESSVVADGG